MNTSATTTRTTIRTGALIATDLAGKRTAQIQPAADLAALQLTDRLGADGWQLATFDNTGCGVLVRLVNDTVHGSPWGAAFRLEVASIETGTETIPGTVDREFPEGRLSIVAILGEVRRARGIVTTSAVVFS